MNKNQLLFKYEVGYWLIDSLWHGSRKSGFMCQNMVEYCIIIADNRNMIHEQKLK